MAKHWENQKQNNAFSSLSLSTKDTSIEVEPEHYSLIVLVFLIFRSLLSAMHYRLPTFDHGPASHFRWHAFLIQFRTPEGLSWGHNLPGICMSVPFRSFRVHCTLRYCSPAPQVLLHGRHFDTAHLGTEQRRGR